MSFHNLIRSDVFSCKMLVGTNARIFKMPVEKNAGFCLISLIIKVGLLLLLNAIGSKEKLPCLKL